MFFGVVWWRSVRGRVEALATKVLLDQTSALHLFEVRSTPLLMRMMPATAWGRCRAHLPELMEGCHAQYCRYH